jgi:hypothetical protein
MTLRRFCARIKSSEKMDGRSAVLTDEAGKTSCRRVGRHDALGVKMPFHIPGRGSKIAGWQNKRPLLIV